MAHERSCSAAMQQVPLRPEQGLFAADQEVGGNDAAMAAGSLLRCRAGRSGRSSGRAFGRIPARASRLRKAGALRLRADQPEIAKSSRRSTASQIASSSGWLCVMTRKQVPAAPRHDELRHGQFQRPHARAGIGKWPARPSIQVIAKPSGATAGHRAPDMPAPNSHSAGAAGSRAPDARHPSTRLARSPARLRLPTSRAAARRRVERTSGTPAQGRTARHQLAQPGAVGRRERARRPASPRRRSIGSVPGPSA
jgi:hypothetical protein